MELPFFQYMVCDQGRGSNDVTEKGSGEGVSVFWWEGASIQRRDFKFLGWGFPLSSSMLLTCCPGMCFMCDIRKFQFFELIPKLLAMNLTESNTSGPIGTIHGCSLMKASPEQDFNQSWTWILNPSNGSFYLLPLNILPSFTKSPVSLLLHLFNHPNINSIAESINSFKHFKMLSVIWCILSFYVCLYNNDRSKFLV